MGPKGSLGLRFAYATVKNKTNWKFIEIDNHNYEQKFFTKSLQTEN